MPHDAVLVIGDAALLLAAQSHYPVRVDLGEAWKEWTGLPFVFAVWAARRDAPHESVQAVHRGLLDSRAWGLEHLEELAREAHQRTGVTEQACREYLGDLDYALVVPAPGRTDRLLPAAGPGGVGAGRVVVVHLGGVETMSRHPERSEGLATCTVRQPRPSKVTQSLASLGMKHQLKDCTNERYRSHLK